MHLFIHSFIYSSIHLFICSLRPAASIAFLQPDFFFLFASSYVCTYRCQILELLCWQPLRTCGAGEVEVPGQECLPEVPEGHLVAEVHLVVLVPDHAPSVEDMVKVSDFCQKK